jgi:hypothetical protein
VDTTEAVLEHGEIIKASPRRSDIVGALGKHRRDYLKDEPDGKWSLSVPREDMKAVQALDELERPARRLHVERTNKVKAADPTVRVRALDGRIIEISAESEPAASRVRGCLPVPSYGGCPVEAGADGMLWRNVARIWVPTGRTCLGTPVNPEDDGIARGPQEDPDGNMWEQNPTSGNWEIRLYAEEREA